jgi:hypothetical protein
LVIWCRWETKHLEIKFSVVGIYNMPTLPRVWCWHFPKHLRGDISSSGGCTRFRNNITVDATKDAPIVELRYLTDELGAAPIPENIDGVDENSEEVVRAVVVRPDDV